MTTFTENLKLRGELHLVLKNEATGEILVDRIEKNRVVDVGLAHIASRLKDATATVMGYMAVGTSSANDDDTQTALGAEVASSRTAIGTTTLVQTTVAGDSIQYVCTFPAGTGTGSLVEAGIFNATPTGGVMLCRTIFGVITKGSGDELTVTWKVVIA